MRHNGQEPLAGVKTTVQNSRTLLLVACLSVPAVGSAQTITPPPEPPPDTAPPFRLFKDAAPPSSGGWTGSIKAADLWKPPASASQVPRWTIGRSVTLNTPGGLAFSGGVFGRRGDPFPLYLSEGTNESAAGNSVRGPGTYRLQWDAKIGVSAPVWTGPRLKMNAVGELFVPLRGPRDPTDPSASVLHSRALRFGVVTVF